MSGVLLLEQAPPYFSLVPVGHTGDGASSSVATKLVASLCVSQVLHCRECDIAVTHMHTHTPQHPGPAAHA